MQSYRREEVTRTESKPSKKYEESNFTNEKQLMSWKKGEKTKIR